MRTGGLRKVLEHLQQSDGSGHSDAQLLARFIAGHDEAAFAALVRRHGPMVLGVCRRLLGHAQDAEDAFQATFLILARKAATVVRGEAVASWLCRVAYRTAMAAKTKLLKRRAHERQVEEMPHPEVGPTPAADWRPLLDRELDSLPQKYRVAVILCDLEGKTRREAARQLGMAEGTFSSQLTRGRRLLAKRLARQGLSLSGGALAGLLYEGAASATVPAPLVVSTVQAAVCVAAGQVAAVTTPAAVLMNEVLKAMLLTKLKLAVAGVMVMVTLGASGLLYRAAGQSEGKPPDRPRNEVEALRHEVELLRFNLEVVLEKCRAQEAEVRALRARAHAAGAKAMGIALGDLDGDGTVDIVGANGLDHLVTKVVTPLNPEQAVEAVLKAFREATDNEAKRRAAERLEGALRKLRQQLQPKDQGQAPKTP
jgi:RNA polymerase sigma factor (sigma-70 family)